MPKELEEEWEAKSEEVKCLQSLKFNTKSVVDICKMVPLIQGSQTSGFDPRVKLNNLDGYKKDHLMADKRK